MQDNEDTKYQKHQKEELLKVLGSIIYAKRKEQGKGINRFSYEYDIGNGLLSSLEKGKIYSKISTLWKISNAFGMKCSELIALTENKLGKDFNFYN